MPKTTFLLASILLAATAGIAQARDLGPDEALRLRDAGTILPFERLNAAALAQHPGATITETELEDEYGRYVYQLELRDARGIHWDLGLDARTGQVLQNHQDD